MQPVKTKKKLSRADKKQIEAAIARANRTDKKEKSAQDSIPYERMWPDGICRVADGHYTKTIQFQDINYQLSQNEDKTAIFEGWCDFLNYFDSSIRFELSFLNLAASEETFARAISIPLQGDDFDSIRTEYTEMLQNQLARGNNGLIKTKYLTFGIDADSIKAAKPRLERIETDILNNFKRLGVAAETLDGKARLAQLHGIFHMDEQVPFRFDWSWLAASGLSAKDFIAPSGFEFRTGKQFRMGKKYGAVSFLQILAPELNDRMLADFLDMESSLIVSLHIQSVDQVKAIKTVKRKITDLDKSKIEEQKKAVRAGYDMDIIPSDLATYGAEAKKLLQDLQSRNERMFLVTFLIMNTADNPRQLDNNVFQASSIAQKYNCQLTRLDFQQEEGLMSCLPLGVNQVEIQRGLTTSSTAIFVPFTTQELFQNGREALYYGINALSSNLIMVDRKLLKNPNGLILGTPGSGKSFSAKREIANCFLLTTDDIIICDPEAEYAPLVERLHGQVIKISPTSTNYINCPLTEEEYQAFWEALTTAQEAEVHGFEDSGVFEGCMPVEVMARRGVDTLRYGPLKPVGLKDPKTGREPYAVVQLRRDNAQGSIYNLVGFQTHLKWPEQKRVFSLIPALRNAEFVRYGVMHRNTYLDSPRLLDRYYRVKKDPRICFAGQITGVEGYVESTASGFLAALELSRRLRGLPPVDFPQETATGALALYISNETVTDFQPMNVNFGIIPPLGYKVKGKRNKNAELSRRALEKLAELDTE